MQERENEQITSSHAVSRIGYAALDATYSDQYMLVRPALRF
jgi:hypothetical protein